MTWSERRQKEEGIIHTHTHTHSERFVMITAGFLAGAEKQNKMNKVWTGYVDLKITFWGIFFAFY